MKQKILLIENELEKIEMFTGSKVDRKPLASKDDFY